MEKGSNKDFFTNVESKYSLADQDVAEDDNSDWNKAVDDNETE
jgi:hypothetical protein